MTNDLKSDYTLNGYFQNLKRTPKRMGIQSIVIKSEEKQTKKWGWKNIFFSIVNQWKSGKESKSDFQVS